jgi:hypothetical protein
MLRLPKRPPAEEDLAHALRALAIADAEVAAAECFLNGLRRELCPTSDPMWVGGTLRLHIASHVAREARTQLRLIRRVRS